MIPGEIIPADAPPIEANPGLDICTLAVANTGRRTMNVEPTPSTLSAATSP